MKRFLLFIAIVAINIAAIAKKDKFDYNVKNIPDSLKENTDLVVRYSKAYCKVIDLKNVNIKIKKAYTVLNEDGASKANFKIGYDKLTKVKNIKINLYDAYGKRLRKISKREIKDVASFSDYSLFSDNRVKYFEPLQSKYPYTVVYEYEHINLQTKWLPVWYPCHGYNVSVENSEIIIDYPETFDVRLKKFNYSQNIEKKTTEEGRKTIKASIKGLKSIESEVYSPTFQDIFPHIWFAPNKFNYDNVDGDLSSWENYGKWAYSLLKDRNNISGNTVSKIKNLIKDAKTDKDKIKIIYKYLQDNSRYVSIQLGIGGFQPFPASKVDEVGYGDCKALSNYMCSLLKIANIESYYTIIGNGANYPSIKYKDFPSLGQANHIVVCVPNHGDTLWLECTSQYKPCGFIGNSNCNRNALLVTKDGGKIVKTPFLGKHNSTQIRNAEVEIDIRGLAKAKVKTLYHGGQYDNGQSGVILSHEKQEKELYEEIDLNNFKIKDFSYYDDRKEMPTITENLDLEITSYVSTVGKRIFIPLNMLNRRSAVPRRDRNRKFDVINNFPYTDIDSIKYTVPKGLKIESRPKNKEIKTDFGEYISKTEISNDTITYVREIRMNKFRYKPERFNEFRDFLFKIKKADNAKVVMISK